jgi:hypothetical protein
MDLNTRHFLRLHGIRLTGLFAVCGLPSQVSRHYEDVESIESKEYYAASLYTQSMMVSLFGPVIGGSIHYPLEITRSSLFNTNTAYHTIIDTESTVHHFTFMVSTSGFVTILQSLRGCGEYTVKRVPGYVFLKMLEGDIPSYVDLFEHNPTPSFNGCSPKTFKMVMAAFATPIPTMKYIIDFIRKMDEKIGNTYRSSFAILEHAITQQMIPNDVIIPW